MYRKIEARMWTDPKFRRLKSNEKLVFLYLITCPGAHVSGVYYLSIAAACDETGLVEADLRYSIDTLSGLGLIRFDPDSSTVWVVNMLRYQGRGEKIMISVAKQLADVHSDAIVEEFKRHYKSFNIPYRKGIDTLPIGVPRLDDQEQDQEQDQEEEKPSEQPPSSLSQSQPPKTKTPTLADAIPGALAQVATGKQPPERKLPAAIAEHRSRLDLAPGDRSRPPAMVQDSRPGGLQPELEEIRARYAAAWGKDPTQVAPLSDDHLRRARMALSDDRAGITLADRIKTAFAAIKGHHRKASADGYEWRDLQYVFPQAKINGRSASNKLDMTRYLELANAGRDTARVKAESKAERERRQREAEIERERAERDGKGRVNAADLFAAAEAEARKG
jgi:hypothetical protein